MECGMTRPHTAEDFLDSVFNLRELLSLSEDELAQLEEVAGDLAHTAEWWRRRRRRAS
jgi:esterase/lipase superfamily enzyme